MVLGQRGVHKYKCGHFHIKCDVVKGASIMVKFIKEDDFSTICRCISLKPDADLKQLELDLCGVMLNLEFSPDSEPATGVLKKMLEKIENLSKKQITRSPNRLLTVK